MNVIIFGLVGHAGSVTLPLDTLELDELAIGREFPFNGKLYEIRSFRQEGELLHMNVVMIMDNV